MSSRLVNSAHIPVKVRKKVQLVKEIRNRGA